MKNWYYSLLPRERNLVSYGSIIAAIMLFWLLLFQPQLKKHDRLNKEISDMQKTLELMKVQSVQIAQYQRQSIGSSRVAVSGNPQQQVETALQTWRLKPALERMQSQGANAVRLTLKNANADFFMRFLQELEQKYRLNIESISISSSNDAGKINVRLTVKK